MSLAVPPHTADTAQWALAEECPVAFLIDGENFAVMMATPRDLEDFAIGFLLTERIIDGLADLTDLRIAEMGDGIGINCRLTPEAAKRAESRRRTLTGRSGCGICGAQTLETALPPLPRVKGHLPADKAILGALDGLAAHQPLNSRNHSTHAAALAVRDGTIALAREDVGRHNALDKLAGALARAGVSASTGFIVLSSRISVEMVQKAAIIGSPLIAAHSAPTDLAVRTAKKANLALACRNGAGLMHFPSRG